MPGNETGRVSDARYRWRWCNPDSSDASCCFQRNPHTGHLGGASPKVTGSSLGVHQIKRKTIQMTNANLTITGMHPRARILRIVPRRKRHQRRLVVHVVGLEAPKEPVENYVERRLVPASHDESTFQANDGQVSWSWGWEMRKWFFFVRRISSPRISGNLVK